jgi:hypothetical protein
MRLWGAFEFLMLAGKIKYNLNFAQALKGIAWKNVNLKFKNDYGKALDHIFHLMKERGIEEGELAKEVNDILKQIRGLDLELLGEKIRPPEGDSSGVFFKLFPVLQQSLKMNLGIYLLDKLLYFT